MQMPIALQNAVERELEGMAPQAVKQAAQTLSLRYRQEEKAPTGARLARTAGEVCAYAAFRMPATFGELVRAMELAQAAGVEDVRTLTDVGAGSGAALWAARQVWPDLEEAALVEREEEMIALSQRLWQGQENVRVHFNRGDMLTADLAPADLVTASYCLGELAPKDALQVVRRLWAATGRALLIVEPGTPAGHARIRQYAALLQDEGAHMAAPCPSLGVCPLPPEDWCHFTVRVERTRLHRFLKEGELPYEDEKFSFLAVAREPAAPAPARVRRHPLIRSGYVELPLCRGDRIETVKVTRRSPAFKQARKAEPGDGWTEE